MKILLVVVLLLYGPFWSSHLIGVDARADPAVSPGTQVGIKEHRQMDPNKNLVIALIVASSALGAILLSLLCLWNFRRRNSLKTHQKNAYNSDSLKGLSLAPFMSTNNASRMSCNKGAALLMDYKFLETATENFQESKVLGEGGFGCVYKAKLGENIEVAVKRLNGGSPNSVGEFETEVELLSKIQHPNIISLLGYSLHGEARLLVYELMQNGSLETQLHGPSHGSALSWHHRMKIALDTARGLEYLHEQCKPPVIHRDLKSSNILLDSNFNAKLSDFGLAIADGTQNKKNLKLSGTLGYVAPEYLLDGELTDKSDVYGFGVVLLELLLGRMSVEKLGPSQCQSIVSWAMPQITDRSKLPSIVDPVIRNTMDLKHLYQVAAVAVLCVQPEPSYRPLIKDVLYSLIPLVPVKLGGTLTVVAPPAVLCSG
ncbi:hypothetical protein RHSIM_Rhsim07G0162200 [Rhododendron simsii]|uniref:Protein kinase domain-containing protein n=1 Tax=Rhododendron simsii TaxID=118357 RepID=A0A834LKK0_RHOSS|nr:hypothetical protein RHSIM_Rhsim07G0162200 [Rhododendron simsii]